MQRSSATRWAATTRLRERHAAEEDDRRRAAYEATRAERDELAAELARVYPPLAAQLADLLGRLRASDEHPRAAARVAIQLREAEDRIAQLQDEVERLQSHAARAEQWLETIRQQIQDTLIGPLHLVVGGRWSIDGPARFKVRERGDTGLQGCLPRRRPDDAVGTRFSPNWKAAGNAPLGPFIEVWAGWLGERYSADDWLKVTGLYVNIGKRPSDDLRASASPYLLPVDSREEGLSIIPGLTSDEQKP